MLDSRSIETLANRWESISLGGGLLAAESRAEIFRSLMAGTVEQQRWQFALMTSYISDRHQLAIFLRFAQSDAERSA